MDTSLLGEFHETWIWFSHKSLYHISKGTNRVTQKWREILHGSLATKYQTKNRNGFAILNVGLARKTRAVGSAVSHQPVTSCSQMAALSSRAVFRGYRL